MSWHNIKRDLADILFSKHIRKRAKGKCEYCGKVCEIDGIRLHQLEASHYFGRAHRSVRFDYDNVHALCSNDHKRMGGYKREENGEYDLWIKKLLGEKGYRNLVIRANQPCRIDKKLELIFVKNLINERKI